MMPYANTLALKKMVKNDMSDILAAFAILLAVFTYIESIYNDFIQEGIDMEKKHHARDNKSNYERVKKIVVSYQLPLLVISFIISLIMAPVSIEIVVNSVAYM